MEMLNTNSNIPAFNEWTHEHDVMREMVQCNSIDDTGKVEEEE